MQIKRPFKISSGGQSFHRGVSIRTQLILGIGLIGSVLMIICLNIVDFALNKSLRTIQDQLSVQRVERMMLQVSMFAKTRIAYAKDNAEWDDAYAFFEGKLPDFLAYNYATADPTANAQLVVAIDRDKKLLGRQATHGRGDDKFEGIDIEKISRSRLLGDEGISGFARGSEGSVFMVASHPVRRSDRTGISPGWLVFIKEIDTDQIAIISELTGVPVSLMPPGASDQPHGADHLMELHSKPLGSVWAIIPEVMEQKETDALPAHASVFFKCSVEGREIGFFVDLPSRLFAAAYQLERTIRVLSVGAFAIMLVLCLIGFEAMVVRRVLALDADLQAVVDSRNENLRVRVDGRDEIARVADTSNRMLESLATEHRKMIAEHDLLESVLHSVGEGVLALTPVRENQCTVDFQVATLNAAAARYFEKNPDQLSGALLSDLRGLGDAASCVSVCDSVMKSGKNMTREVLCSGDPSKWVRLSVTAWVDGVVLSFEDITARKENERALSESLDELTRLTSAMMGREDRILELKSEVNALCKQLQRPPMYESAGINL